MSTIRTLTPAVAALFREAPVVQATVATSDYACAYMRDPDAMESMRRYQNRQLEQLLGQEVFKVASKRQDRCYVMQATHLSVKVVAMSEAELAVLLTRAYEAGRRS